MHGKANRSVFATVQTHQINSNQALITRTKMNFFQVFLHIPSESENLHSNYGTRISDHPATCVDFKTRKKFFTL